MSIFIALLYNRYNLKLFINEETILIYDFLIYLNSDIYSISKKKKIFFFIYFEIK